MPRKTAAAKTVAPNGNGDLRQKVAALEQRVDTLEASRPGRKAKPMVALREKGVCAIDPNRDSETCPDASIFRYQLGCHGTACRGKQHESYERRKARKTTTAKKTAAKAVKAPVRKAPAKKAPSPLKKPTKRTNPAKVAAKKAPAKLRAVQ